MPNLVSTAASLTAASLAAALLTAASALAGPPRVQFDVADMIACRDVTTPEFIATLSGERLIEARFEISSLITGGGERSLVHFLYRIESPQPDVRVVDYLPRTKLVSDVVGEVAVETKRGQITNFGISAKGHFEGYAAGDANASHGKTSEARAQYKLLPPLELVAASGTINRAHGVYFKLRPSKQTSLEGAREFACVFRVPAAWQAGTMMIQCRAVHPPHSPWYAVDAARARTEQQFQVALYVEGHEAARQAVVQLLQAQRAHDRLLAAHHIRQQQGAYVVLKPGYGTFKEVSDLLLPGDLSSRLTEQRLTSDAEAPPPRLPDDLRTAAARLSAARQKVQQLGEK